MAYSVILEGGMPWGFRLQGGKDFDEQLRIAKLNPNSKAYNQGVGVSDFVDKINGTSTHNLKHTEALQLIRNATNRIALDLRRNSARKKTVLPEIRINGPPVNGNISDSDFYYSSCDEAEGIVRTNAVTTSSSGSGHQSEGENSGSTSDSQSSVVHVVGPYTGPAATKMKQQQQQQQQQSSAQSPQAATWAPFGQSKVKSYKPVSFNLAGGGGSASSNSWASPAAPATTSSFAQSGSGVSGSADKSPASGPSYNNFNGSNSVVVTSAPPGSAYTSITMNSRKATDSPTQQFSPYGGSPFFQSSPLSPTSHQPRSPSPTKQLLNQHQPRSYSPTKQPQLFSPTKQSPGPFSPKSQQHQPAPFSPSKPQSSLVSPTQQFGTVYGQTRPQLGSPTSGGYNSPTSGGYNSPTSGGYNSPAQGSLGSPGSKSDSVGPLSPVNSGFGQSSIKQIRLSSPPKSFRPGSPVKAPGSPVKSGPISPTKSTIGPFSPGSDPHRRPSSPSKTVTFGPVTARVLSDTSQSQGMTEDGGVDQTKLSFSKVKSLFEHKNQQSTPPFYSKGSKFGSFGSPSSPASSMFSSNYGTSAPSNATSDAPYCRPSVLSPTPQYRPKSKGLSMFLNKQNKFHDEDDDLLSEFTDSEEAPQPKPSPLSPTKPSLPTAPIVGRAMPIKMETALRDITSPKPESEVNGIQRALSPKPFNLSSGSSPKPGFWQPGQASPDLSYHVQEQEIQRQKDQQAAQAIKVAPAKWGPLGQFEAKKDFKSVQLEPAPLKFQDTSRPSVTSPTPEESFAWKPSERTTVSSTTLTTTTMMTTTASPLAPSTVTSYSAHNGSISHHSESKPSGLPSYQSPTITLLQKGRDLLDDIREDNKRHDSSELLKSLRDDKKILNEEPIQVNKPPPHAVLVAENEIVDGDMQHTDSYYVVPGEDKKTTKVVTKKKMKYQGIGPTEAKTGVPIIPRGSLDETQHKEWYKTMYRSLHKQARKDEPNTYKPTYVFPEEDSESEKEDGGSTMSLDRHGYAKKYSLPDARYREEKFKVQPRSIENYEPGFSSIAFREARSSPTPAVSKQQQKEPPPKSPEPSKVPPKSPTGQDQSYLYNPPIEKPGQFSQYICSDSDRDIRKSERPLSPQSDVENREAYKRMQKGGDIPYEGLRFPIPPKKDHTKHAHASQHRPSSSPMGSWDRKMRDEEVSRRKQEMKRITIEEKKKRMEKEMRANEARRHNDFLTPTRKSPIPLNRYDDVQDLPRPETKKKMGSRYRGKAKALYSFSAQSKKELSFRKHDIIYLLRQIDKNWCEGEHHGRVGIFPFNYIEVLTSLDEAREAAILHEGTAKAKYTFNAQSGLELSFKKGDSINLVRRIDANWYEGRIEGKHGIVPALYVDVNFEPDTPMSSVAPTPMTGSPGQLSPVSTISNGPAPTIPSAPISPRSSVDNYDFSQPFNFGMLSPGSTSSMPQRSPTHHPFMDIGLNSLSSSRPSSALGGRTENYQKYDPIHRPNSAIPFTDYYGKSSSTRDSGFYSSEESKHSRQRQQDRTPPTARAGYQTAERKQEKISANSEGPHYPPYRAVYNYRPQNADELELNEGDLVYVMEKCDDDWFVGTSQRSKEFGTFPGNYVRPL